MNPRRLYIHMKNLIFLALILLATISSSMRAVIWTRTLWRNSSHKAEGIQVVFLLYSESGHPLDAPGRIWYPEII